MIVTPIASTVFSADAITDTESVKGTAFTERMLTDIWTSGARGADLLGEFAGRSCYQAWNMPNPATANNKGYLANILKQGHYSVLEHSSVTFYVEGVSRSLTHELVRHRHLSFSELSQRYVNMEDASMVTPPALRLSEEEVGSLAEFEDMDVIGEIREAYEGLVKELVDKGHPRKQAREAARAVMPNATETKIVVTGNLRAWRDMLGKRYHVAADAEIREFATEVLRHLRDIAPNSVQDIPDAPFN